MDHRTGDLFGEMDMNMGRTAGSGSVGGMEGTMEMGMGMQGLDWLNWFNVDVGSGGERL
jgi:hypothetical protein